MDEELKTYLDSKFGEAEARLTEKMTSQEARLTEKMTSQEARFDAKMTDMEARLIEKMRDMQTELLRGFQSFSAGQTIRLRKLEADQSNLDASLRGRVDVVEFRLLQIESRLGIDN
jgi:hypothetical protein